MRPRRPSGDREPTGIGSRGGRSMASARTTWSTGGRAALVAVPLLAGATLVFDHPLPALAFGFVALLVFASLPGRGPLDRLELLPMPPAWLVEDETRLLDAPYRLPGVRA